uniref:Uncharacterized protein n=1 Tax=Triticum aestivum TaxID=4565 RepID=A0A3B6KGN9_WHEAT
MVSQHGALLKVGLFVLVQVLVYLILAQSSFVFSTTKTLGLPAARAPAAWSRCSPTCRSAASPRPAPASWSRRRPWPWPRTPTRRRIS